MVLEHFRDFFDLKESIGGFIQCHQLSFYVAICYGSATNKWRITRQDKFIDPSTGVGLLKSYSPDYLFL
jgi:hypothetical protein